MGQVVAGVLHSGRRVSEQVSGQRPPRRGDRMAVGLGHSAGALLRSRASRLAPSHPTPGGTCAASASRPRLRSISPSCQRIGAALGHSCPHQGVGPRGVMYAFMIILRSQVAGTGLRLSLVGPSALPGMGVFGLHTHGSIPSHLAVFVIQPPASLHGCPPSPPVERSSPGCETSRTHLRQTEAASGHIPLATVGQSHWLCQGPMRLQDPRLPL